MKTPSCVTAGAEFGQVSLNQPASSIPLATLAGLVLGGIVGWLIYRTGSTSTLHWFLVSSTCLLFLIGAGLASKAVGFFQYHAFAKAVGGDVAETGDGPGSFKVQGNIWHFTWGNPEVCLITFSKHLNGLAHRDSAWEPIDERR